MATTNIHILQCHVIFLRTTCNVVII
jgi:hypothetical protein